MLRSLLSADGVNPDLITVFIDGYFEVSKVNNIMLLPTCNLSVWFCVLSF